MDLRELPAGRQVRMLGRYQIGWCDDPRCCPNHRRVRKRKRAEQRAFQSALMPEASLEWLASFIPGYDLSDCRHGCNGDCLVSGSERCSFTCHPELDPAQLRGFAGPSGACRAMAR